MARFSRNGSSHPFGKCDTELKTQLPAQLRDELVSLATLRGQTVSEYLREIITLHLHGNLTVVRMMIDRAEHGEGEKTEGLRP